MRIDWWTLAIQTVNVLILVWLLGRFLYRPVMAAIAARQSAARKLIADAEEAKQAAQRQEEEQRRRAEALKSEEARLREKAQAEVEADRAAMMKAAADDAAKARAANTAALERDRDQVRKALERDAASLAVDIAGKLVARFPAEAAADILFQGLMDQVGALPDKARSGLTGPVELVCARSSGAPAEARFRSELATALPQAAPVTIRVDPDLVAGFELRSRDLVISNSWRSDLERISHELAPAHDA